MTHSFIRLFTRLTLVLTLLSIVSCQQDKITKSSTEVFNTHVQVKFYKSSPALDKRIEEVFTYLHLLHDIINNYEPTSEISQMNNQAHLKPFKCSDKLWQILQASKEAYQLSDGKFDVTAGTLMRLWGFHRKRNEEPSKAEIQNALKKVGMDKVIFDTLNHTIKFKVKGIHIDLGGIAKGYALDKALEIFQEDRGEKLNLKRGILDFGGNIYCFQQPPASQESYKVGVRHPSLDGTYAAAVPMLNQFMATSGDYERFVKIHGKKFSHIVDPTTGYPVEGMAGVTVITEKGIYSDVLSTTIFVGGPKEAQTLLNKFPKLKYMIITHKGDGYGFETYPKTKFWSQK